MPKTLERTLRRPKRQHAPTWMPITREQCEALVESGSLVGRYELIDGEIISKMGQKPLHAGCVRLVLAWLAVTFGIDHVQSQLPMNVSPADRAINEPEPDLIALNRPVDQFFNAHPGAEDVALLVEVSDSSLQFDLRTKSSLYARAGIADYWVIDLAGRQLYVHREPASGAYCSVTVYAEGESVAPLARPDCSVRVADLLPPAGAERNQS